MKKLISLLIILVLSIGIVSCGKSEFPNKPITMIVPYGAGGGADISIRMLAKYAEQELGQKIVVSNKTGGSGVVGTTALANAKPDGYTIGYIDPTKSNDKLLFEGVRYDDTSFKPIIRYSNDPQIIVVSKKSGIENISDLIEAANADPNGLTFGIGGAWTPWDFVKIKIENSVGIYI